MTRASPTEVDLLGHRYYPNRPRIAGHSRNQICHYYIHPEAKKVKFSAYINIRYNDNFSLELKRTCSKQLLCKLS